MNYFSEEVFIFSLTKRPEDAKRFSRFFDPRWLQTVQYRPVLDELYRFTKEHEIPPSFKTLHQIFKDKDESQYDLRYKKIIESIENIEEPDSSETLYHLEKAKEVAIVWSFKELTNSPSVMKISDEFDGKSLMGVVTNWSNKFLNTKTDREMNIKEAIDNIIEQGWLSGEKKIPCSVEVIDEITGNGLRPKQLGLLIAPTGHGKSSALIIMSYNFAAIEQKNTLYLTNELSLEEVGERYLAKISKTSIDKLIENPITGYTGVDRHWVTGLDERLRLIEVMREIDTDELEAILSRYMITFGWKPDVLVLDFMERMRPIVSGMNRDQTWTWYGEIAKDLARLSKKLNVLIWTAAQVNRSGMSGDELGLHMAQGSTRHLQEATSVIGMWEMENLTIDPTHETKVLAFKALKARQSKKVSNVIYTKARLGKMEITNERMKVAQIMEMTNKNKVDEKEKKW